MSITINHNDESVRAINIKIVNKALAMRKKEALYNHITELLDKRPEIREINLIQLKSVLTEILDDATYKIDPGNKPLYGSYKVDERIFK